MKTLREMQDSLYAKAKTEKDAKFNTLMDKICRTDFHCLVIELPWRAT